MKATYQFRSGARVSGLKPEIAGAELERIRRQNGGLRTADVVEEARPDGALLHPYFEWDDSKAGERLRLIQASTLIRAVQIVRSDQPQQSVYSYVPSVDRAAGEYDRTDTLAKHIDRWTLALGEALRDLRSAQERVSELKRAAGDQPEDRMAAIMLAGQALQTAEQAIRTLH